MRLVYLLNLAMLVALYQLSKLNFELPGGPGGSSQDYDHPLPAAALYGERPGISKKIYNKFQAAVNDHLNGDLDEALRKYSQLSQDLEGSTVFNYNYQLARRQKNG